MINDNDRLIHTRHPQLQIFSSTDSHTSSYMNKQEAKMEEMKPIKLVGDEEEEQAKLQMWDYALGFTPMAVIKCAIQLQIAELLESHGGATTLSNLSAATGCSPPLLRRVMRYLIHRHFFKQTLTPEISYSQTPLSRLLINDRNDSISALLMLESSPAMIAPWHRLSARISENGGTPFEAEHGVNLWGYCSKNPAHRKAFDDGMACMARHSAAAIVGRFPEVFNGIGTLVDVGGGDGTSLRAVIKACPWIRGINFDLPHVVAAAPKSDGVEHVAGDMFQAVPKADAAFLMRVLHDWNDEECVQILKKCREAITGKVIIAEAVIREEEEDIYKDLQLALDMAMLVHTETGKERSVEEWEFVVREAGFTRFVVKHIEAIVSVIEAYP